MQRRTGRLSTKGAKRQLLAVLALNLALTSGITGIILGSVPGLARSYYLYRVFQARLTTAISLPFTIVILMSSAWYALTVWRQEIRLSSPYSRPLADVVLEIDLYRLLGASAITLVLQLRERRRIAHTLFKRRGVRWSSCAARRYGTLDV